MTKTPTQELSDEQATLLELAKTHMTNGVFDWQRLKREQPKVAREFSYDGSATFRRGSNLLNALRKKGLVPEVGGGPALPAEPAARNGTHTDAGTDERVRQRVAAVLAECGHCPRCGKDLKPLLAAAANLKP